MKHATYAKRENKDVESCRRKWVPVELSQKGLTFYQRNPEKMKQWQQARRERDGDKIRAHDRNRYHVNREYERARKTLYFKMNPQKVQEMNIRRRTDNTKATPAWLTAMQKAQIQGMYEIARAKSTQTGITHHVDHVFPLRHEKFCGLHVPWNLEVITGSENCRKHAKLPVQYQEMLFA